MVSKRSSRVVDVIFEDGFVYPTAESIISIHRTVYDASQASVDRIALGPPKTANIEGAIYHIRRHAGRRGSHTTRTITKAAHLMLRIIAGHAFVDGNKRTGFFCGVLFLHLNGIELRDERSWDEYRRSLAFFRRIAASDVNDTRAITALRDWIKRRTN